MRESLFAFHAEHYSANAMRLVVVGREELDTLQAWVVPLFSKVPNIDRPPPVWPTPPYGAAQLGRELKVARVLTPTLTLTLTLTFTLTLTLTLTRILTLTLTWP